MKQFEEIQITPQSTSKSIVCEIFSIITANEYIEPLSGEFECFEEIARNYALILVNREMSITKNKAQTLIEQIKKL